MKLRVSVMAFADVEIPEELEDRPFYEIFEELQDQISKIDCGQCFNIDTTPFRLVNEEDEEEDDNE